jgi:hypothetical protein
MCQLPLSHLGQSRVISYLPRLPDSLRKLSVHNVRSNASASHYPVGNVSECLLHLINENEA